MMQVKTICSWSGLLLVALITKIQCKQTPNGKVWESMSPVDQQNVNRDQDLPKFDLATRENKGKNDPVHDATRKKTLQALLEAAEQIDIDSDPDVQSELYQKYKHAEQQERTAQHSKLTRQRKRKIRNKNKGRQKNLSKKIQNTLKKLKKNPKFANYMKHKEQEQVGRRNRKKEKDNKRKRRRRSVDPEEQAVNNDAKLSESETPHERKKRFALTSPASLWRQAIVPYAFEAGYPEDAKTEVLMAFTLYEDLTPLRFEPYSSELATTIGHFSKLMFIYSQPRQWLRIRESSSHSRNNFWYLSKKCWSYVGFTGNTDQYISCYLCGIAASIHEIGHAVGLLHEHQNDLRDNFETLNWNSIPTAVASMYTHFIYPGTDNFGRFNPDSVMHYDLNIQHEQWTTNFQPQIFVVDPDLRELMEFHLNKMEHHYTLKEIINYYKQEADPCGDMVCGNDGYATKVRDGPCQCVCPQGFGSNCDELKRDDPVLRSGSWPLGVALLKPPAGCPEGYSDDASVMFKSGNSFAEADWPGPKPSYVGGSWQMQLDFCVRNSQTYQNEAVFQKGDYCYILKQGEACHPGFSVGTWRFNDIDDSASWTGTDMPSGSFTAESVELDFCCRSDGWPAVPIKLPNSHPFVLLPSYMKACQAVEGMQATLTSFHFNNTVDNYGPVGMFPHIYKYEGQPIFQMHACYYEPLSKDFQSAACGGIYFLDDNTPSLTIQSPNYPNNYPTNQQCTWMIHSEPNTKILLNFDSFDIQVAADGSADDYVEIRKYLLGNMGNMYYGDGIHRSWLSYFEHLAVYLFSNSADTKSGFKATVRMVKQSDMCYTGKGENYDGPRSYTRTFQNCVSWSEAKAKNCTQYPYTDDDEKDILHGSYCRNPGNLDMPWCFTYVGFDQCKTEYCDVCNLENCYDYYNDCDINKYKDEFCTAHSEECYDSCGFSNATYWLPDSVADCADKMDLCTSSAASRCADTCGECADRQTELSSFPLECESPTPLYGATYEPSKDTYVMGEEVTFTCTATGEETNQTCSTLGKWLPEIRHACGGGLVCQDDEISYESSDGLKCFKVLANSYLTYDEAVTECQSEGGTMVTEKDLEATAALDSVSAGLGYPIWIGLSDALDEGTFTWLDGAQLQYDKWKPGEPYSYKPKWTGPNTFNASVTWSKTKYGDDCVPWSSKTGVNLYDYMFPVDGSVANAGNNCRDPYRSGYFWCYTASSWGECDLSRKINPECAGEVETETAYYGSALGYYGPIIHYHGTQNTTSSGQHCIPWVQFGYSDSYFVVDESAAAAGNFCRELGYGEIWCFTSLAGHWDTCDVPEYCGGDGFSKTVDYTGTVDATNHGYPCMRWDEAAQYSSGMWLDDSYFPNDGSMSAADNYCRGLYGYEKPWCYYYYNSTTGYLYWSYCPVPEKEEKQDCVKRQADGTWDDAYCDEYHFAVCEMPHTLAQTVCDDQNSNCAGMFEENPNLCVEYQEWVNKWCAKTCGLCSESNPTQPNTEVSCAALSDTGLFDVVREPQNQLVGDYVEYKCHPFHSLIEGNLKRGCSLSGTWTGSAPVCALGGWNNDVSIRDRYKLGASNAVYLGNNDLMRIQLDGVVRGWRVYSSSPGQLELYVFRPDGQVSSFIVVGKTVVEPILDKRQKTIELPPEQWFQVNAGDIIGFGFFSSNDGGIPYDRCKLEYTSGGNIYEKKNANPLTIDSTIDFNLANDYCRIYSIAVDVWPISP